MAARGRIGMTTRILRAKGQLTIPTAIREAVQLEEGDPIEFEIVPEGILLRLDSKKDRDPSQAWFWTPEWQAGERQASADLAAGRSTRHETDEDFLAALKRARSKKAQSGSAGA